MHQKYFHMRSAFEVGLPVNSAIWFESQLWDQPGSSHCEPCIHSARVLPIPSPES
jgi:hypothetical protein